jgi:uncharacterized protein (TIGR00369 family)
LSADNKKPSLADRAVLEQALASVFAPWVRQLQLSVIEAHEGEVLLRLPVAPMHVHGGGVLCGQTMMAAADTAMVLAVMTRLGGFKPMTTVQLQTSFLRPIGGGDTDARVAARVLRFGKNLIYGAVDIVDGQGQLAAHATTTYMLL